MKKELLTIKMAIIKNCWVQHDFLLQFFQQRYGKSWYSLWKLFLKNFFSKKNLYLLWKNITKLFLSNYFLSLWNCKVINFFTQKMRYIVMDKYGNWDKVQNWKHFLFKKDLYSIQHFLEQLNINSCLFS